MKSLCTECGAAVTARGLCKKHYRAFMLYGDAHHRENLRGVPFNERYHADPDAKCWLWVGGVNSDGYGVWTAHGETKAHRASWVLHNGAIPAERHVLHKCDRPNCVNPDHLFLGTHQDDMADLRAKGRAYGAKGEANYSAKLTSDQAMAIMCDGRPGAIIAAEFGITKEMVSNIRNGKSWTHLYSPEWKKQRLAASKVKTLTDAQRLAIYFDPRTQHVIAAEYGISQSRVSVIKRGEPP